MKSARNEQKKQHKMQRAEENRNMKINLRVSKIEIKILPYMEDGVSVFFLAFVFVLEGEIRWKKEEEKRGSSLKDLCEH